VLGGTASEPKAAPAAAPPTVEPWEPESRTGRAFYGKLLLSSIMKIALCLGGGGAKGSFQAGVLHCLQESGITIDSISGTSVGALNGALVAQRRAAELLGVWRSFTRDRGFFARWRFGRIEGFFRGGLFDPSPLRRIIRDFVDPDRLINSGIHYSCCSVDLITGEIYYVRNDPASRDILKDAILASASYYVGFPPVRLQGKVLTDGGAREAIPAEMMTRMSPAADRYVIITCNSGRLKPDPHAGRNAFHVYTRLLQIVFDEADCNDLRLGQAMHWNDPDRFVIIKPEQPLMGTLECDPDKIERAIEHGYETARKALLSVRSAS
jgi:predicted acylesterase/phospholipase RssA